MLDEGRIVVDGIAMRWLEPSGGPAMVGDVAAEAAPPGSEGPGALAVVMVHGIPTSAELWRRVLPAVEGARALAWEMVGYGDSIPAGRGRDISVARQAEYLMAWLRALDIQRALLVGHDLGGGVVQRVVVDAPDLCVGLVLTNTIAYDSWPVRPMRWVQRLHRLVRGLPDPIMARGFELVMRRMHDPTELGIQSARIHWAHYARHGGAAAFVRQALSLDQHDTMEIAHRLPELDVPARVVWGDADPFQPISRGRRLARDLGTDVHPIPGGLHFTPEDRPDPIARAINELVAAP